MKKLIATIIGWFKGELHLIEKSSNIALSAFKNTVNDLKTVEASIENATAKRTEKANKLAQEVAKLAATKEANKRVSDKINEFLNG